MITCQKMPWRSISIAPACICPVLRQPCHSSMIWWWRTTWAKLAPRAAAWLVLSKRVAAELISRTSPRRSAMITPSAMFSRIASIRLRSRVRRVTLSSNSSAMRLKVVVSRANLVARRGHGAGTEVAAGHAVGHGGQLLDGSGRATGNPQGHQQHDGRGGQGDGDQRPAQPGKAGLDPFQRQAHPGHAHRLAVHREQALRRTSSPDPPNC